MTKTEEHKFDLRFGIFADPLENQLKAYGVTLKNIKKYDLCMDCISTLFLHGYLTDKERERVYKRFLKDLKKDLKENLIPIKEECENG